ncbi:3D (Asp-Asp-Asp) domain-containing protein [Paenibacillus endophyticus]|uniref:3D (Asp-Asp-Asp) domain-containing protein n=1 Tax=Paenibacillus endophyticus TaxID=1294268 RepID=A0A7W5C3Y1_9BACL|nr:3D domain-containing protein [Paenibacillus endophyticus]MBB3150766.1 3D (Asp-Asp-Asp) domain-containing protein [Paenibacillus endophyticus]
MFKRRTLAAAVIGLSVMMAAGTVDAASKTHTTTDNDTFWKLSMKYSISVDALMKANPKVNSQNIYKGLKLNIPVAAKQAAAAAGAVQKTVAMKATEDASAQTITAINGKEYAYSKSINVQATAYTAAASENGKWGAVDYFGDKLKVGTIAVDPKMIPLGTKLYVTGYDYNGLPQGGMVATATDIGGSINGNRIDIFVPGVTSQAKSFGFQDVKVFILE